MGKTNPVKERKCSDLDEDFKQWQQENAIVGEEQEQEKEKTKTTRKAKRSRCIYSLENAADSGSLKPSSTECDSSASNSKDDDGDQASEPSSAVKALNDKDQKRDGMNTKALDHLDLVEVETRHQSSFFLDNEDMMEIVLVDVQLDVNASPRAENAPFVSLTSEAYGIAVIGHPLDVGEIRDESVACKLLGDGGRRLFGQLVWRTCKRSPVCYVKDAMLPAGEDGLLRKEKSLIKLLKNSKKGKKASNKTCVPVQLIFSKILAAVD